MSYAQYIKDTGEGLRKHIQTVIEFSKNPDDKQLAKKLEPLKQVYKYYKELKPMDRRPADRFIYSMTRKRIMNFGDLIKKLS